MLSHGDAFKQIRRFISSNFILISKIYFVHQNLNWIVKDIDNSI